MPGHFSTLVAYKESIVGLAMVAPIAKSFRGSDAAKACAQLIEAAESISSNIAEGWSKGLGKDCIRYLYIALASAGEVHSRLRSAVAAGRVDRATVEPVIRQIRRVESLIEGLIRWLQGQLASQ